MDKGLNRRVSSAPSIPPREFIKNAPLNFHTIESGWSEFWMLIVQEILTDQRYVEIVRNPVSESHIHVGIARNVSGLSSVVIRYFTDPAEIRVELDSAG